eukprot:GDKH01024579.1.p2 GENE.GDKH01024579.1~~GDKH01024579.1.p2  ORF type:complete len:311 (+),score=126.17 GDKH01024579.1:116-1048(+)
MVKLSKKEKKQVYFQKLTELVTKYPNILLVNGDNVGSKHFANIRYQLRGRAIILFGKNTMIRTCLRALVEEHPQLESLIDIVKLNVGFIFCIDDPSVIRKHVEADRKAASAKQGAFAPCDVKIPAGPSGLDPAQTSFFQALGIPTKITKGTIEIINEVHLIKEGNRVAASQAALLQKLGIKPFEYGLVVTHVYDNGSCYPASVLDITDDVLRQKFAAGLKNVACMSLGLGIPTQASMPHLLVRAYKNCVSLCLEGKYAFPQMQKIRDFLENPEAFAVAAAPAAGGDAKPAAAAAVEEEEEEEEAGFDLFD